MTPLLFVLLQAGTPAAAPPATPPATERTREVVVTARPLDDTARALADCLARDCPPREDIDATLAHAENQFVVGDYPGSRRTLRLGRDRNARYARDLPVEVADLSRANARLGGLNGMPDRALSGEGETLRALQQGLPADDARILHQRLEIGDVEARQGLIHTALRTYGTVADRARAEQLPGVEARAMFRTAALYNALTQYYPQYGGSARHAIDALLKRTDPAFTPYRDAAALLKVPRGGGQDRAGSLDKALAPFQAHPLTRPVLVYAPTIDLQQAGQVDATTVQAKGDADAQWADVSFWITADGTVRDVDVLRESPSLGGRWLDLVTKSVARRRYAPLALDAGSPGLRRVERFSLVFDRYFNTRSRIFTRWPVARLEVTDLSTELATK